MVPAGAAARLHQATVSAWRVSLEDRGLGSSSIINYQEVLDRGYVPGRDLRIAFGDGGIARCLLVAPHGGGIEPGTSELLRAISDLGGWAWYEFAGFLRKGNQEALHIASTLFDEPTLLALLPRTNFVLTLHGANYTRDRVVYVGGRWEVGRATMTAMINAATGKHGIEAKEAPADLRGTEPTNLTNRQTWAWHSTGVFARRPKPSVSAGLLPPSAGPPQSALKGSSTNNPQRPTAPRS